MRKDAGGMGEVISEATEGCIEIVLHRLPLPIGPDCF